MILRTPFQALPRVPSDRTMDAFMPKPRRNLPYGLDIWDAMGNVLSIEWDRGGGRTSGRVQTEYLAEPA